MLGDVAVAVHPDDARYSDLVGKLLTHPFRNSHSAIPIVADEMVDPELGSGAVKITPAHSAADLEVARRHNLPILTVIDDSGKIDLPETCFHVGNILS